MSRGPQARVRLSDWLRVVGPRPRAQLRLLCFAYAGGGTAVYRTWPRSLPEEVEVCVGLLPGREDRFREAPLVEWQPLLDDLERNIGSRIDTPLAIFGHSLGALVGYELAQRLREAGSPPIHLFASGCRAPHLPTAIVRHTLGDEDFRAALGQLNGVPPELAAETELMDLMLPVLRADFQLAETYRYRPRPPLPVPITAFAGTADPEASREKVEAWREHTASRFAAHVLPGDHFFLRTAETELIRIVSLELTRHLDLTSC